MENSKDPDYLCAFARALHEVNPATRRNSAEYASKKEAEVLDALARLIVYKPRDQIVALGATQNTLGHIELYVAGNTDIPPEIADHLNNICTRLVDIRATVNASSNPAAVLDAISEYPEATVPTTEPALLSLRELREMIYMHSLDRIRARFEKLHWRDMFQHLAGCIKGTVADTQDLSEGEKEALKKLRSSQTVQDRFRHLDMAIGSLMQCIDAGSNVNTAKLCVASASILDLSSYLKDDMEDFDAFVYGMCSSPDDFASHLT